MTDLELWLIGTADQVTAAVAALTVAGRIVAASPPEPLFGADAGRVRRYARLAITTPTRTPVTARRDDRDQAVIPITARTA